MSCTTFPSKFTTNLFNAYISAHGHENFISLMGLYGSNFFGNYDDKLLYMNP